MPANKDDISQDRQYQSGFGNIFATEALPNALPQGQNSPQQCPYNLYAEVISGTAFTAPRRENQRTWMYRIRPSVSHLPFQEYHEKGFRSRNEFLSAYEKDEAPSHDFAAVTPNQLRWRPFELPEGPVDFVSGLHTICGAGSPGMKDGYGIHVFAITESMADSCLSNADGDFLFVPQEGALLLVTELGKLEVRPGEIAVVQRGIRFQVALVDCPAARGYLLEVFNGHFVLPDLGLIGSNGLANPRDFLTPVASFEERSCTFTVFCKFHDRLFRSEQPFSPFNVVAWHGNYAPYKYDLALFCPVGTVAFDHQDPSIFTVLTCPSTVPGTAIADFVIFPPRWIVAEGTFRPPYFHRNSMSEFMGLIRGSYDAKADGFAPGGASLHSCMMPHGPDAKTFEAASTADLKPTKIPGGSLAFMFEVNYIPRVCDWALECPELQKDYYKCWQGLGSNFSWQNGQSDDVDTQKETTQAPAQEGGPT